MRIADVLTDLAACLCAELTPDGAEGPDMCFCGVMPGAQPAMMLSCADGNCKGQAWVRLTGAYPAVAPAIQSEVGTGGCGTFLGFDIEVGIARCIEVPYDGQAPTVEMQEAAVIAQVDDIQTIRKVIACCPTLRELEYELGTYIPIGPEGVVVAGFWTVSVVI